MEMIPQDDTPFDEVLQFAYIAGPMVIDHLLDLFGRDDPYFSVKFLGTDIQKIKNQQRDVVFM